MEKLIQVEIDNIFLEGMLVIPKQVSGIVLFAHGSGSSRLSPRNNFVASMLHKAGLGTLLIDLLTTKEDKNYAMRFDINLLTQRIIQLVHWLKNQREISQLPIGLFGASTGAAAALMVAAELGSEIAAVVSRGGRPDLAMTVLNAVIAPTLLIVGSNDFDVLALNQQAYHQLLSTKKLEIVEGATHLFEEPGTLEKVAVLSKEWFLKYFSKRNNIT